MTMDKVRQTMEDHKISPWPLCAQLNLKHQKNKCTKSYLIQHGHLHLTYDIFQSCSFFHTIAFINMNDFSPICPNFPFLYSSWVFWTISSILLTLSHLQQICSRRLWKHLSKIMKTSINWNLIIEESWKHCDKKEKLLVFSNFYFWHNVYKSKLLQRHQKALKRVNT